MAEVLTPMIPQPNHSTMLQGRSSPNEAYQSGQTHHQSNTAQFQHHGQPAHHHSNTTPQQQPQQQQHRYGHSQPQAPQTYSRMLQMPRNQPVTTGYRGTTMAAPVPQYAFKSTPQLRHDVRPAPAQQALPSLYPATSTQQRSPVSPEAHGQPKAQALPNGVSSGPSMMRPYSQAHLPSSASANTDTPLPTPMLPVVPTSSPRLVPSAAASANADTRAKAATKSYTLPELEIGGELSLLDSTNNAVKTNEAVSEPTEKPAQSPSAAAPNVPRRYRRVDSTSSIESIHRPGSGAAGSQSAFTAPGTTVRDNYTEARPSTSTGQPHHRQSSSSGRNEAAPLPTRTFGPEPGKRGHNPSPLSRPMSGDSSGSPTDTYTPSFGSFSPSVAIANSPAVAAMAALNMSSNDKEANKSVKSKLRRAFSFGSAAELKKATNDPPTEKTAEERARARQEQFSNELDEEQSAIAAQQEAAGLGNSIYSGQGNFFTGSTDNLSISSTASSASMMLRKMGRGMKKGGRSLKGLFRPKSVIGVPPPDEPVQPSVGPISMVTVEAERQQVNVNADPHDQPGGGTGFPHLERNSLETGNPALVDTRKSIVGGENERAEVLATIKKGILKRSVTDSPKASPSVRPFDETPEFLASNLPFSSPGLDRKGSPSPSTASSEPRRTGHRRTDSSTLEGDDYFASVPRIPGNQSTRSLPNTPRGLSRNISFSPRIQFHDVWSSTEYDRRGEIATCNRLTPMLAQQIKEELNTFKMEMEVHELSKPHTHFF